MSNYQETNVTGSSYLRCSQVILENPLERTKGVTFDEERVYILSDGKKFTERNAALSEPFTPENAATEFQLLDPATGAQVGQTVSYQHVYAIMYSLYLHLAARRDEALVTPPQ